MKKENIMPVVVLTVICLVSALLMGVVNMFAAPEIERAQNEAANAALTVVLPDGKNFEEISLKEGFPSEVTKAYKADGGYVFEATVSGNKPGMVVMCGINSDGKIVGVDVVKHEETPSYWEKVSPIVLGTDSIYSGKTSSDVKAELVSGATKSSTAVYKAVKASLDAYTVLIGGEIEEEPDDEPEETPPDIVTPVIERTEDEMKSLAIGLYQNGAELEELSLENPAPTTVKVWKNTLDGTYALYLATRTQYTPLETEAIFVVNGEGTVIDLVPLKWTVGHGVNYTVDYINSFIGKNKYSTDEVELVSEATTTSKNLVNALENALRGIFGNVPMSEEDILKYAEKAAPAGEKLEKMELPEGAPETVKAMFKLESGRGFVFYTSTSTTYVKYETEAFIYADINGKVMNVDLLTWTVGHGVDYTEEFLDSFKGKTKEILEGEFAEKEATGEKSKVDHVTAATGTSDNLSKAVIDALSLVPEHTNYSVIAAIILAAFIGCAIAYTATNAIIRRKRR